MIDELLTRTVEVSGWLLIVYYLGWLKVGEWAMKLVKKTLEGPQR